MAKSGKDNTYTAAAVQAAPVFMDIDATIDKGIRLIHEAAKEGATLIAFPETWVPTYPLWIFGAANWGDEVSGRVYRRLHENALMIGGEPLKRLCAAAAQAGAMVVIGASEKLSPKSSSLFNSQFFISDKGKLLGVHRKLMPTYTERNIWAYGDGSTLHAFDTDAQGRVGGLICWEHWMPLTRFAMHAKHEDVHVAAWPELPEEHHLASRHYAFEGKCYVICVGSYQNTSHIPEDFELMEAIGGMGDLGGDANDIMPGGSGIIGPDGKWVAGPVAGKEVIIYGEIDLNRCIEERLLLDSVGHYNRPDVFRLTVDNRPRAAVDWSSNLPAHMGENLSATDAEME